MATYVETQFCPNTLQTRTSGLEGVCTRVWSAPEGGPWEEAHTSPDSGLGATEQRIWEFWLPGAYSRRRVDSGWVYPLGFMDHLPHGEG